MPARLAFPANWQGLENGYERGDLNSFSNITRKNMYHWIHRLIALRFLSGVATIVNEPFVGVRLFGFCRQIELMKKPRSSAFFRLESDLH
jgi:hypothetical protein